MDTQPTQANQPSGAPPSVFKQPITEADLDFSRLDRTVDRYRLLLLAKRVGKEAGFTPRMLQLLEYYMAYTTAKDWEEGRRPIVFQSLARTAMDLGVGERQIQKLEKRLFDIGAICWNDSGNHKRYGRRCGKSGRLLFAYGVDLTPLAYLEEELQEKLHEKQLYAEAWRATKRQISETRRQIRERLTRLREEGANPATLAEHDASYCEIAYELRSHIDLARLRNLATRHTELLGAIDKTLASKCDTPAARPTPSLPIAPTTRKRSRSHARKFAHQQHTTPIQITDETTESTDDVCHATSRSTKAIGTKTFQPFSRQASPALQTHLPPAGKPITKADLIKAASRRRIELGISQRSWAEACHLIGRNAAANAIVLTDHACGRPDQPVRHPTSYFRRVCGLGEKAGAIAVADGREVLPGPVSHLKASHALTRA